VNDKKDKDKNIVDGLDLDNMPDMSQLLNLSEEKRSSSKKQKKSVSKKSVREIKNTDHSFLETQNMPDMAELLEDAERISFSVKNRDNKPLKENRKKTKKWKKRQAKKKSVKNVVIDGSNIARLDYFAKNNSSLAFVLSLILSLKKQGYSPVCVFDANERYEMRLNPEEPLSSRLLVHLINHLPCVFKEAPVGSSADDVILRLADEKDGIVVSNDKFAGIADGYARKYKWLLAAGNKRLQSVSIKKDCIICSGLGVRANIDFSIDDVVDECFDLLAD